jgi:hypothetical protein
MVAMESVLVTESLGRRVLANETNDCYTTFGQTILQ